MPNTNRPLSPFMIGSAYKPQLTSMLSILHRLTGAALAVGLVLLTWFLFAVLEGEHAFSLFRDFRESFIGQIMLFGWLFSFVYHFLNGIRHLKWDLGYGFALKSAYRTGYIVVIGSVILTVLIWTMGGK
jgi:succinate dehydrogenase / fumarate reductase cytochrome b subunit